MSKYIAQLMQADQRNLSSIINRLELVSLNQGVDTKLTAEIITQSRYKIRLLGLDPQESTKKELYYGLLSKAESDDFVLRRKLDITNNSTDADIQEKIIKKCYELTRKDVIVCMQVPAVKQLLKAVPPKKTMRILNFRSIDSVLKRENPLALYALATRLEDKSWHAQVQARLKRLNSRDVKESKVNIINTPVQWKSKLEKHNFENLLLTVAEVGVVMILPFTSYKKKASVLLAMAVIMQSSQKLAIESLPYRTKALTESYEKVLPDIASGKIKDIEPIYSLNVEWKAVYRLLAQKQYREEADFDFILDDLEWQSIETKLASVSSELDFWVNSHYLGFPDGESTPISMHLTDVATNLILGRDYQNRLSYHLKASLWNELQLRYLLLEKMQKTLISQLTVIPEVVI